MPEFQPTVEAKERSKRFKSKGDYKTVIRSRALKAMDIAEKEKKRLREEESVTPLAGARNHKLRRIKVNAR